MTSLLWDEVHILVGSVLIVGTVLIWRLGVLGFVYIIIKIERYVRL